MSPVAEKGAIGGERGQDVDMKDISVIKKDDVQATKEEKPKDVDMLTLEDVRQHALYIEWAVNQKDARYMYRVLRCIAATRRKINSRVLRNLIQAFYPQPSVQKEMLLNFIDEPMETDTVLAQLKLKSRPGQPAVILPEQEVYIHLLVVLHLIDANRVKEAVNCSDSLMEKIMPQNRRTLDMLAAKCYFYHSRVYELTNQLSRIRSFLHARLRTSTLRSDFEGQATLLNLLLRNYLHYNLYEQADKLVSKATFPESANNNEWARYLYYLGRIKAIQLDYTEAHKHLLQAIRKAPQHSGAGFRQTAHKFAITVELLLGDIPERSIFRQPELKKTVQPYFLLTQAVLAGNLARFNEVLENFGEKFKAENTWTLIIRLRHNVIKTGVRMINLSYSRISLVDIANKLQLDSPEDAEYIVAKAIRDGVIEATIDHKKGCVQSKETMDIYSTREPMDAFHQRIVFCLDTHTQCVKAMRFPPKSYNKDIESAEERREKEQQDLELAKELADEDDDFA